MSAYPKKNKSKEVSVVRVGNHIEVHFEYDPKIVSVMRTYKGWYRGQPVKHWQFKPHMETEIIEALKKKGFFVRIFSKNPPKKKKPDPFAEKDVISVYGKCKKCGEHGFVGKDGLCTRCK